MPERSPAHADRIRALLISNSTMHGGSYLGHCGAEIRDFLGSRRRVMFVPYALADHDGYTQKAAAAFAALGHELFSVHTYDDPLAAVRDAEAVFIGGGNTFRLQKALLDRGLQAAIRARATAGMPYIGSSAGTNVRDLVDPHHQRHADRAAEHVHRAAAGAVPDQPALPRPGPEQHAHG